MKSKGFKSWNLSYPTDSGSYHALYPESWYVYELPGQNVNLTCHQLSPIIPHNYKDSSLPVALFDWSIENNNSTDIDVALMFTWQSGSSSNRFELKHVNSKSFNQSSDGLNMKGVLLRQKLKEISLEYCLCAIKRVCFNCSIC